MQYKQAPIDICIYHSNNRLNSKSQVMQYNDQIRIQYKMQQKATNV
jgi:hypothetical protein